MIALETAVQTAAGDPTKEFERRTIAARLNGAAGGAAIDDTLRGRPRAIGETLR